MQVIEAEHRYGAYVDAGPDYRITTPIIPTSWFNYLFNDEFYIRVDQTGRGFSRAIGDTTRVVNPGIRSFYIYENGEAWCPLYAPLGTKPDRYSCTHRLSESVFAIIHGDLEFEIRVSVPSTGTREHWTITCTNRSSRARTVDLWSYFAFDSAAHMGFSCTARPNQQEIRCDSFPHHAEYDDYEKLRKRASSSYLRTGTPWAAACTSEESFMRGRAAGDVPGAVSDPVNSMTDSHLGIPAAAIRHCLSLDPQQTTRIDLEYGCRIPDGADEPDSSDAPLVPAVVDKGREAVSRYWDGLKQMLNVTTPDEELNRFVNYYWPKEIIWMTRLWRGGISTPWRNELQDALGYAVLDAEGAWPYLQQVAAIQDRSGFLQVWNTREGHRPNHPLVNKRHCDGSIWLAICLIHWGDLSGDLAVLDRPVPFSDGSAGDISGHIAAAIEFSFSDRNEHGLVRMHDGDWTDPLNGPGRFGMGGSTWATMALSYACRCAGEMWERAGDASRAQWAASVQATLRPAILAQRKSSGYFSVGTDDEGDTVPRGERVFLNSQSWAVLSGVVEGPPHVPAAQMTPFGPRVVWPPFTGWDEQIGRLSLKTPGTTENGSVYCHASSFYAYAAALAGETDVALQSIIELLPTNPENPPSHNLQVPIYQANSYFGIAGTPEFGRSSGTLGTGTCTWAMLTVLDTICGWHPTADGVRLRPQLPAEWASLTYRKRHAGRMWQVTVSRDTNVPWGQQRVFVDGEESSGEFIDAKGEEQPVSVEIRVSSAGESPELDPPEGRSQ